MILEREAIGNDRNFVKRSSPSTLGQRSSSRFVSLRLPRRKERHWFDFVKLFLHQEADQNRISITQCIHYRGVKTYRTVHHREIVSVF
jgi:hypothetical protein